MWAELTWYVSCIFILHLRFPTPSLQDWLRQWWEFSFKSWLPNYQAIQRAHSIALPPPSCQVDCVSSGWLSRLELTALEAGQDFPCTTSSPILRQHWGRRLEPSVRKNEREVHDCTTVTEQRLYPKVCPQDKWIKVTCATLFLAFSRFKAVDFINSMCSFSNLILFHNNFQIVQGLTRAFSLRSQEIIAFSRKQKRVAVSGFHCVTKSMNSWFLNGTLMLYFKSRKKHIQNSLYLP